MRVFWEAQRPLTSMDVSEILAEKSSKQSTEANIHRTLKSLLEKGAIRINTYVPSGKLYARVMVPSITLEDYEIQLLEQKKLRGFSIAKIALGLTEGLKKKNEPEEISDELIEELEAIIERLKDSKEE